MAKEGNKHLEESIENKKKIIANTLFDILKEIQPHFKVACAGGAVEWLCGDLSGFGDIDIYLFSNEKNEKIQKYLLETYPKSFMYTVSEYYDNAFVLGSIQAGRHPNYPTEFITVQFIKSAYSSVYPLLERMDLPNVCGSAIIHSRNGDKVYLTRVSKHNHVNVEEEPPYIITSGVNVAKNCGQEVQFYRFRKYCIRLKCGCLSAYKKAAPAEVIKRCKLFSYVRPEKLSHFPFSYKEFYNYINKKD